VFNILDSLAGDDRFVEIRKQRQVHGRLTKVEQRVAHDITSRIEKTIDEAEEKFKTQTKEAETEKKRIEDEAKKELEELKKKEGSGLNASELVSLEERMNWKVQRATIAEATAKARLVQDLRREMERANDERRRDTHALNDWYKTWAVVLPPIAPLLVALAVFAYRRGREKEGVPRSRLR
jgi:ABC-2 type transport system permease protein